MEDQIHSQATQDGSTVSTPAQSDQSLPPQTTEAGSPQKETPPDSPAAALEAEIKAAKEAVAKSGLNLSGDLAEAKAKTAKAPVISSAPAYAPNFKYKVANQEKEIAEFLRGAIKDPDTEKKIRELCEKADGLDIVKPRLHEYKDRYKQVEGEYKQYHGYIQSVLSLKEQNPEAFFKEVGVNDDFLFNYVKKRLDYLNADPIRQRELDAEKAKVEETRNLQYENQELRQQYESAAVQARTVEFQSVLARPDVQSFSENFDRLMADPSIPPNERMSFEDKVIELGETYYLRHQKDLSAEQAVKMVMSHYGPFVSRANPPASTPVAERAAPIEANPAQAKAAPVKASEKPPVIPVVNGRPSAPTERVVRDIDDLKAIYNEKYGNT